MNHKAWRFHDYGGPEVLRLETLPLPEPGPGEVRIKVRAAGLNRSDLLWTQATFFRPQLPAQLGAEVCGVVDKVGEAVAGFSPGDRVTNLPIFTRGADHAYSHFAEYAVIPADELVHTPAVLSDAEGAAFMFVSLTQVCGLVEVARLKPGQTLLVTAGASANGLSAIDLGRRLGARVIATTRKAEKRAWLTDAGAHCVVVTDSEDLAERVAAETGGRGVDVAYDCVGGAMSDAILRSLTPGGQWLMYGFLDPSPVTLNWAQWFACQPTLRIFALTQFTGIREMNMPGRPAEFREAVRTVLSLTSERALRIPIAQCHGGIESVRTAFEAMASDIGGGKIVVTF